MSSFFSQAADPTHSAQLSERYIEAPLSSTALFSFMKVLQRRTERKKKKNERGNGILGSKPNQMVFLQQIFYPGHCHCCYSDPDEDAWSVNAIVEKVVVSSSRSDHYFDVVVDANHDLICSCLCWSLSHRGVHYQPVCMVFRIIVGSHD